MREMVIRKPRVQESWKVALVLVLTFTICSIILETPASSHEELRVPLQYHKVPPPSLSFFSDEMKSIIFTRNNTWDKLNDQHPTRGDPSQYSATPRKSKTSVMDWVIEDRLTNFMGSHNESTELELRETLQQLLDILSTPTYHCKKLIKMGGIYCNRKPDGEKCVCFDPKLSPPDEYCLVYSVGVGHDFSFDLQMGTLGCEVFAFDSDVHHKNYPTFISSRLTFYKVRMGTYFLKEFQYQGDDKAAGAFLVEYWPLPAVMARLGHIRHQLHYLKLDIEGAEWEVLEETVFKTDILEGTQQLSLEVHLDDLRQGAKPQTLLASAAKYLRRE